MEGHDFDCYTRLIASVPTRGSILKALVAAAGVGLLAPVGVCSACETPRS